MNTGELVKENLRRETSWLGFALLVLGALDQSGAATQLLDLIPAEYRGAALSLLGTATLVLRNIRRGQITVPPAAVMFAFAVVLGALAAPAHAQTAPVLTFTPEFASGNGRVTPILHWSAPGATSCTASGAWSGAKAASGTETLPEITSTAQYGIRCDWAPATSVRLSWTPPTTNTDGSPYNDAQGYIVYYGTSPEDLSQEIRLNNPALTSYVVEPLAAGTYYFNLRVLNQRNVFSDASNTASKTLAGDSRTEQLSVVVNPVPVAVSDLAAD